MATQAEQIKTLKAENKELKAIIADMQNQLDATVKAAPKAAKTVAVELDKKNYSVNPSGAFVPGKGKFTAEEIAADADLAAHILKIKGQTILKEA